MIDAHRIASKLWMGSRPSFEACGVFDVIVLMAFEHQALAFPCKAEIIREPILDGKLTAEDVQAIHRAAREVNAARAEGKRVLVTCNMGINRSGVVVATALMLNGMSAARAIRQVRKYRKGTKYMPLFNQHFVRMLKGRETVLKESFA